MSEELTAEQELRIIVDVDNIVYVNVDGRRVLRVRMAQGAVLGFRDMNEADEINNEEQP